MTNKHAVIAAVAMVAVAVIGGATFAVSQGVFDSRPVAASSAAPVAVDDCTADAVRAHMTESDRLLREFLDHQIRAGSGTRAELSAAVADMQSARRRYHDSAGPACVGDYRAHMEAGMDATIAGALALMADERTIIDSYLVRSTQEFKAAIRARERIVTH